MQKHLPTFAMVVGTLLVVVPFSYAVGRMWYAYSGGLPFADIKLESARVTLLCLMLIPIGALGIGGGWLWRRNNREIENYKAGERERKARPEKPRKYRV